MAADETITWLRTELLLRLKQFAQVYAAGNLPYLTEELEANREVLTELPVSLLSAPDSRQGNALDCDPVWEHQWNHQRIVKHALGAAWVCQTLASFSGNNGPDGGSARGLSHCMGTAASQRTTSCFRLNIAP